MFTCSPYIPPQQQIRHLILFRYGLTYYVRGHKPRNLSTLRASQHQRALERVSRLIEESMQRHSKDSRAHHRESHVESNVARIWRDCIRCEAPSLKRMPAPTKSNMRGENRDDTSLISARYITACVREKVGDRWMHEGRRKKKEECAGWVFDRAGWNEG